MCFWDIICEFSLKEPIKVISFLAFSNLQRMFLFLEFRRKYHRSNLLGCSASRGMRQTFSYLKKISRNDLFNTGSPLTWKYLETWENLEKATFLIINLENGVEVRSRNDKNLEFFFLHSKNTFFITKFQWKPSIFNLALLEYTHFYWNLLSPNLR